MAPARLRALPHSLTSLRDVIPCIPLSIWQHEISASSMAGCPCQEGSLTVEGEGFFRSESPESRLCELLGGAARSDTGGVGALALPTVGVDLLDLVSTNLGFLRVELLLFRLHLAPLVAQHHADGPVVLARVHVGVLATVFLGEQHEAVHGPSRLRGVRA